MGPSEEHAIAVAEGARHHLESKTYSGSLMRPHVPYLSAMIERLGIASALDYGCGKGAQYRWQIPAHGGQTIEQLWGFEVTKFDPCYAPYAAEPEGLFDLVLCTHTLSLLPAADLEWALKRLFGFARRAVYIAEKIGGRKKREVADPQGRAIGRTVEEWLDQIAPFADECPQIETVFSSRERVGEATVTTRHRRQDGRWIAEIAGPR